MEYDPLIKTGALVVFYVALFVLIVLWVFKKRKQIHFIKDNEKAEVKRQEKLAKHGNKPESEL